MMLPCARRNLPSHDDGAGDVLQRAGFFARERVPPIQEREAGCRCCMCDHSSQR